MLVLKHEDVASVHVFALLQRHKQDEIIQKKCIYCTQLKWSLTTSQIVDVGFTGSIGSPAHSGSRQPSDFINCCHPAGPRLLGNSNFFHIMKFVYFFLRVLQTELKRWDYQWINLKGSNLSQPHRGGWNYL